MYSDVDKQSALTPGYTETIINRLIIRENAMSAIPYSRYIVYPIPWYSFLIVLGAALAVFIASREEQRVGLKKDTIIDLSLFLLPAGILGARIYYVLFSWQDFRNDIGSVFRIWEGGLAIYGGIIAGFVTILIFCRKRRLPFLLLCDIIVPGLALAQSIGRWGNYFNIEAYGWTVQNPHFCLFPLAVQVPADGYAWHLATFFYESVWDFIVFIYLLARRKRSHRQGAIFFSYAFLYACGRLVIEELRLDSLYAASSVRISQLISVLICILIFILCQIRFSRSEKRKLPFMLWTSVFSVSLLLLLIYSLFPSSLLSLSQENRIIILLVCSATLIISYELYFSKSLSMKEIRNAYN